MADAGDGVFQRSFVPKLKVRSGAEGDGRTIYGIIVPYDKPVRIDDTLVESWKRGVFNDQLDHPEQVRFDREHAETGGVVIGRGTLMRDDPAGAYMEFQTSRTARGNETVELVKDRVPFHLSVSFATVPGGDRHLGGQHVQRVRARLKAVAVVLQGAFGDLATVGGVRDGATEPADLGDADLWERSEYYLRGLPELPDHALRLREIRLGL